MIFGATLGTQDHWLPFQIFNDNFDSPIVEEVTKSCSTAYLRNLNRRSGQVTDVLEGAIVLVQEQEFGLTIFRANIDVVYLRIDVAIDHEEVQPAIVVKVKESISPANIGNCAGRDSRCVRGIGETHVSIVAI